MHLSCSAVDGAVGYLVHRRESVNGDLRPVDHRGGDVLAVPDCWYVDTTGEPATSYEYAVASLGSVDEWGRQPGRSRARSAQPHGQRST